MVGPTVCANDKRNLQNGIAEGIAWCSAFALEAVAIVAGNSLTIVLFSRDVYSLLLIWRFPDLFRAVTPPFYIYAVLGDAYQL